MSGSDKINFWGDEICYGPLPRVQSFLRNKEVHCAAALMLFGQVASHLVGATPTASLTLAGWSAVAAGILLSNVRVADAFTWISHVPPSPFQGKSINKRPGINTPPADPKWCRFAQKAQRTAKAMAAGLVLGGLVSDAFILCCGVKGPEQLIASQLFWASAWAPVLLYSVRSIYRWGMVAEGKWIVEDERPARERAKKKAPAKARFGVLVPEL